MSKNSTRREPNKNIFVPMNISNIHDISANDTNRRNTLRNRKSVIDEDTELKVDPSTSHSKGKNNSKKPLRRQNLPYYETDDLSEDSEISHHKINPENNQTEQNQNESSRLKRNLILDDNDLVIIQTATKANQLKLQEKSFCIRCGHRLEKIFSDLRMYANALQLLIAFFISGLILLNLYLISSNCSNNGSYFCVKRCNYSIMLLILVFINFITYVIFYYDNRQSEQGGFRPNNWLLMFLIWAGGWLVVWPLFFSYKNKSQMDYKRSSILMTFFSVTGPFLFLIMKS